MNKQALWYICVSCLLLFSCTEKQTRIKPENVLSEQEMIAIITDIQLVEGAISKKKIDKNVKEKESPLYYQKVFEKHKINENKFNESVSYYTEKPKELVAIYEKVLIELSKIKVDVQTVTAKETIEETK